MRILDHVKGDQKVHFRFYRDGQFHYITDSGFEFPVPLTDVGSATLLAEDRALIFMRWIRRQAAALKNAKEICKGS